MGYPNPSADWRRTDWSPSTRVDWATAFQPGRLVPRALTSEDMEKLDFAGREFRSVTGGTEAECLVLVGDFSSDPEPSTDEHIRAIFEARNYPFPEQSETKDKSIGRLNVVLDSGGGSLDAAFRTALCFSHYTNDLRVYVPRRAKSASTLLALGAQHVVISPFGELGPLDTQIPDPRNPAKSVSALDCYQSADYVRGFGMQALSNILGALLFETLERELALSDALSTALKFSLGNIQPVIQQVNPLDFGYWGRTLKIAEKYAVELLSRREPDADQKVLKGIAKQLVYGYTHHPYPIDFVEAKKLRLKADAMTEQEYRWARTIVETCTDVPHISFIDGVADNK